MEKEKRKFKLKTPNSYVIIMAIIAIVAVLSWIIPGGAYDYVDPNADKLEPIAGTFHTIASHPQGLWAVIMAPITGFMDSVDIILYCLVIGGYIALVMKTWRTGCSYRNYDEAVRRKRNHADPYADADLLRCRCKHIAY